MALEKKPKKEYKFRPLEGLYKRTRIDRKGKRVTSEFWSIEYFVNGVRYREQTTTTDRNEASVIRAETIKRKEAELLAPEDKKLGRTLFKAFCMNFHLPELMKQDVKECILEYEPDILSRLLEYPAMTEFEYKRQKNRLSEKNRSVLETQIKHHCETIAPYVVDSDEFKIQVEKLIQDKLERQIIWHLRIKKQTYKNMVNAFRILEPEFGNLPLEDITYQHLKAYRTTLSEGIVVNNKVVVAVKRPATRNKRLNFVRATMARALEMDYIDAAKLLDIRRDKSEDEDNEKKVVTTYEERQEIIRVAFGDNSQLRDILHLLDETKITQYKILRLTWSQVFLDVAEPYISADGDWIILSPEAIDILKRRLVVRRQNIPQVFYHPKTLRLYNNFDLANDSIQIRDIVQFVMYSGLRQTNALRLRWKLVKDLDTDAPGIGVRKTKNKDPLFVGINSLAAEALRSRLRFKQDDIPFVFYNKNTRRPFDKVEKQFNAIMKEVGRPDITFHGLRHIFMTMLAETGASTHDLMHFGGQRKVESVNRYVNRDLESQVKVVAKLR